MTVSILSLQPGESPRLDGPDKAHIARLAETDAPLPPVLVDRRSMQVIDGMHRLLAALLNGRETIEVEFFEGSTADAFLLAVEANVTHGFPLSQADRRAAAERILVSHAQMSDRAIAESTGLAARTVAAARRRSAGVAPQVSARVGRDGRLRPVSHAAGRQRAAALLAEHPGASLREVARGAGVSPATARDVRGRLGRGEEPAPTRARTGGGDGDVEVLGQASEPEAHSRMLVVTPTPDAVLEKLVRDPSLRHSEDGRRLLLWLRHNTVGVQGCSALIAVVPPHCAALVVQLAHQYAQMWLEFAQQLDERARVLDPWGSRQGNGRK